MPAETGPTRTKRRRLVTGALATAMTVRLGCTPEPPPAASTAPTPAAAATSAERAILSRPHAAVSALKAALAKDGVTLIQIFGDSHAELSSVPTPSVA